MAAVWISKRDAIALVASAQGPDVVSRSCARSTLAGWVRRGMVRTKAGEQPPWAKRPRRLSRATAPAVTARPIGPRAWRLPIGDPRLDPPASPLG